MKRMTIKGIAKALNVSVSTVSKALNDSYEISEGTKKRIREFAKEHKYRPNSLALSLQNRRTKNIAVLVPSILNHFFAKVLDGIEKVATERGYKILTFFTHESYEKEVNTVEMMSSGAIDGFIACLSEETLQLEKFDHFKQVIEDEIPLVLYDRAHKDLVCDKVVIDNIKTAYKATRYLMRIDNKSIGLVSTINNLNVGKFRVKGYKKALQKYGWEVDENKMVVLKNAKHLKERVEKMLTEQKVDSIFAIDETAAVLTLQVAHSLGIEIPKDLSIIGFSNGVLSKYSTPALTVVNQHGTKIGKKAANRIIDKIEEKIDKSDISTQIIRTDLIERDSTHRMYLNF